MSRRQTGMTQEESVTGAVCTTDANHAQIHEKKAFELSGTISVPAASVAGIKIIPPPAGTYIHFQTADFSANGGPVTITLLEDYSFTEAAESELTPVNLHRIAPPAALTVAKAYPDITADAGPDADTLRTLYLPGATQGVQRLGVSGGNPNEIVIKPDTDYLVAISNAAASPTTVGFYLFWYEEGAA